ncbi:MAG: Caib/baif family protein [Candidatus Jorgensenbacteria bacterium GW2011_GWC1_48_8]|nr:MAG: Caib/baif family protein [Candidatus Jorgensenbacteria bacterium GW2011_GWC1_48_8]
MMFYPQSPFKVYCYECWFGDNWNPMGYGKEYDFSQPFFEQFSDLLHVVPRPGILKQGFAIESEYTNRVSEIRNCYLIFGSTASENCFYGSWVNDSKECVDCYNLGKCERCYDCTDCVGCYNLQYSRDCHSCSNSYFLLNCRNCESCFGCTNLRNKSYCVFNKQYGKEEYQKLLEEHNLKSSAAIKRLQSRFISERSKHIVPSIIQHHSTDVSGNWIEESKNVHYSFNCRNVEDGKYVLAAVIAKDVMDYAHFGRGVERIYDSINIGRQASSVFFSNESWDQSSNLQYCMNCRGSQNLFGCIGVRNKSYCILNREYTKEEYEKLVPRIIEHMNTMPYADKKDRVYKYGEFFPPEITPFAYNESLSQEFFPLTKERASELGYRWKDEENRSYKITVKNNEIPDTIRLVSDAILDDVIGCEHGGKCNEQCTTAFKIVPQELNFYRQFNIPLPNLCPNCRHYQRLKQRNPLKLWHRKCMCDYQVYKNTVKHVHHPEGKCPNEFKTSYAPERPEIVYCEQCYNFEVV